MNINSFFPLENATKEELMIEEYKKKLFKLSNRSCINTLQYKYFVDFIKNTGTICNLEWFIEQVCNLKGETKHTDVIDEFKISVVNAFPKFFKYKDGDFRINKNIKYYMTRLDTISLTKEQKKGIRLLYDFLIDRKKTTFGLYGFAGSGKTTTMVEFVSYLVINGYLNSIVFTAPTNKAVNVIKSKFKPHLKKIIETKFDKKLGTSFNFDDEIEFLEQQKININFMTIHKLLKFQTEYSISGEMIFIRDNNSGSMIPQYEIVIIDECSMISMDMIDNIFEEIRFIMKGKSKTYIKTPKIIFTGDPAQLPPVNEEDSSIFCKNKQELSVDMYMDIMNFKLSHTVNSDAKTIMNQRYELLLNDLKKMNTFLLKTVVRSKIDTVTEVCYEFRKWIKKDKIPNLKKYIDKSGVYFYDNNKRINKINSKWFKQFLKSIKRGNTTIIVTWTNKQTDIYNDTIRRVLFKGNDIKKFEPNDILMLSEFYGLDLGENFVKQKLYTSEQIRVITTKLTQVPINMFDIIVSSGLKKMKQGIKIENKLSELIKGLNIMFCHNVSFKCWILKVHKFGEDCKNTMILIVIDDIDKEKYDRMKSQSGLAIKNFAKYMINQYRTCPKQIERCVIKPLWKQWNKIFSEPFANVNYGYSITCHKAQGSNFYDVYVDIDDILQNTKRLTEAKKCAYTAVSRTSNELHLLV
jgi:hypothetical protein